eukprot:gene6273-7278_t
MLIGAVQTVVSQAYTLFDRDEGNKMISDCYTPPLCIAHCHRLLYVLLKVRGSKTVVKLFPHQVNDLLPVLTVLEQRTALYLANDDRVTWEEIYVLSLWMSLLIITPFKFTSIDGLTADSTGGIADRIVRLAKSMLAHPSKCRDSFAELLAKLMTRPDMVASLHTFISWTAAALTSPESPLLAVGIYTSLATIFKKGTRSSLVPLDPTLYRTVVAAISSRKDDASGTARINRKLFLKLVQRMAALILPPITASWRYQRVIRPLLANPTSNGSQITFGEIHDDEDVDVPEQIEEIIEVLSEGLADKDTVVRWTSAKGIGRIVNLLPRDFADQVIGLVLDSFQGDETLDADASTWHGACLALAELCRRGLLLPHRLDAVVPLVCRSLFFDVTKGTYSVGSNVRDAACYIAWALARTYHVSVLAPHTLSLARTLIVVSLYDREINCRKSASAAFQETVGRQGTVPSGIDIVQLADYIAVGNRRTAYTELAPIIAARDPYFTPILEHLVAHKIIHWDQDIRTLAATSLRSLLTLDSDAVISQIPRILQATTSDQIPLKHGGLLSLSELLAGLFYLDPRPTLSDQVVNNILSTIRDKQSEKLYKGKGGVLVRTERASSAPSGANSKLSSLKAKISMLKAKSANLQHPHEDIQKEATQSLKVLFVNYMATDVDRMATLVELANRYIKTLLTDANYAARRGASLLLEPIELPEDSADLMEI